MVLHLWDEPQSRIWELHPWKICQILIFFCSVAVFHYWFVFWATGITKCLLAPECQHLGAWALLQWSVGVCHATLDLGRGRAIRQLQAGVPQNQVAVLFGLSPSHHWRQSQYREISRWNSGTCGNPVSLEFGTKFYPPWWQCSLPQSGVYPRRLLGVERLEWPASSYDLNPNEHLLNQLGCAVRTRLINTTMLADFQQMLL